MKKSLLFASLLATSLTANAAFFEGSTSGVFVNPQGPSGMVTSGVGTNSFSWGDPATTHCWGCTSPSSLTFHGLNFAANVDDTFALGVMKFYNGTIWAGTEATSVDFSLTFNFTSPNNFVESFTYDFALDNTPNTGDPNDDADSVKLTSLGPQQFYSYQGTDYYFELLGFNGQEEMVAKELKWAKVKLVGQFTSVPSEIPLPAAVWLFGSGLMGFMAFRRRAKMQAAV